MRKRLALSLLGFGLALTVQAQTPPAHSSATPASPPAAGSSLEKSLDRALAKADKGDEAGAIQILEGLRKDPAVTPPVLSLLGGLYLKTNRPKEAMELLKPLADAEDADPAVLFNTARAAFALGQKAEGVQYLERSVALAPASPAARALGLFLAREGQPEQAYDILLPWVAATPDDFEARLAAALLAVNLQHFADAEKLLKGMPKNNPRVELLAGDLALRQGNPKASIATLRPLVDNPPPGFDTNSGMEADARRLLAEAYLRTGQPNDAIKLLSGREKGDPATALLLAQAQFQGGATPAALATLSPWTDKILKADKPRDPELVVKMAITYGRILTAAGRLEEAATAIGVATRLDPGSPEAWDAYGKTLAAQGKKEDSAKALARSQVLVAARARGKVESRLASAENPGTAGNPGNPGSASPAKPQSPAVPDPIMALVEKGQFEQALNLVREQIKLEPKDLGPRILEMRLLLLLKRPQEALKSAQAMVDLAPGSADAIYARGVCRLALEQPKEGEEDLRQALKIQPGYLPAMNDLAVVLMVRGEKKEAQSLLEKVLAANPNDKVAAENLRKLKAEGKAGG